jgi:hypothetical protein
MFVIQYTVNKKPDLVVSTSLRQKRVAKEKRSSLFLWTVGDEEKKVD